MMNNTLIIGKADIELFIITYNRSALLAETLQSIHNQSVGNLQLTIIDNGSNDDTQSYCQGIDIPLTNIIRNDENLPGNLVFKQIAGLAAKKFLMVFHDDDIMHPQYVAAILHALNSNPDLVLLGSLFESFNTSTELLDHSDWLTKDVQKISQQLIFKNEAELAAFFYKGYPFHFASAVYKTAIFKTLDLDFTQFGKICDRPFLLAFAAQGKSLVFDQPFIKYRIHFSQDSSDNKTGPFFLELSNLQKLYCTILTKHSHSMHRNVFNANSFRYLQGDFQYLKATNKITFSRFEFFVKQYQYGATNLAAISMGIYKSVTVYTLQVFKKYKSFIVKTISRFLKIS